ncbi:unnamed protein product [Aphis gossypii]|uniref:Uncharacterized protein n=1 Tax=Aphis gossypii TaxID=80765 RepID=A0A9P0JFU4_APHGO|nr:unnamed protein product [Aphis gossypii]
MVVQYKKTIVDVLKLAKANNFNIEDLECRKIDINQNTKLNDCVTTVIKSSEREQMVPWILINNEQNYPTFFHYDLNNNGTKCRETDNESFCSCTDESENCCSTDNKDNCTTINDNCCKLSNSSDTDCKKEGVRDELMTIKGEMNILHQQNRDFLCKLNSANQQTHILTNALKNKLENESGTCQPEQNGSKSKAQVLMLEINRLNDELKGLKRDRCQIELAKKVLNISDALCANCAGPINQCDGQEPQCKDLTTEYNTLLADHNNKLLEITNLRKKLSEAQCTYKNYEDRLKILKTQVCQLQKQLFDFTSAKSHDPELACSNEKYLIESLRNRLQDATEEKTNMQMALDFHLTELEDKKSKFLAVLQTNQEQKFRIESICKEKNKIAEEYEAEFNRMNDHLKSCLDELGTLPGLLATAQRDLEKETSKRLELEEERNNLLKKIESLNAILANDDREEKDRKIKYLEEENTQLNFKSTTGMVFIYFPIYSVCAIDERLRSQIELLTTNLNEAQKQIEHIINAKHSMEDKTGGEICKIPRTLNSACHGLNKP